MPRRTHYSPCIDRVIVCALYHEGRRLRRPMTRLVNDLLTASLQHTQGWSIAATQMAEDLSQQLFGIGVKQLNKMQASQLIEDLLVKAGKPAPRQTRWQQHPTAQAA